MLRSLIAAAVLVLASAAPTYADDAPSRTTNDLRCLVVGFNMAAAQDNAQVQEAGKLFALYYLGRVHGEAPTINLEDAEYAEASAMTAESFNTERVRCATEFQTIGQDLIAMGQRMTARSDSEAQH